MKSTPHERAEERLKEYREAGLPIYGDKDQNDIDPGLYLGLFHGFASEEDRREADDWGVNGPMIGPLKFVHGTYAADIKFEFVSAEQALRYGRFLQGYLSYGGEEGDLILCVGLQFGDFTVFNHPTP